MVEDIHHLDQKSRAQFRYTKMTFTQAMNLQTLILLDLPCPVSELLLVYLPVHWSISSTTWKVKPEPLLKPRKVVRWQQRSQEQKAVKSFQYLAQREQWSLLSVPLGGAC
jgi:hypothetical protein